MVKSNTKDFDKVRVSDTELVCSRCFKRFSLLGIKTQIHYLDGTEPRSLGIEEQHSLVFRGICDCCNEYQVQITYWIYPRNLINYQEIETANCICSEKNLVSIKEEN